MWKDEGSISYKNDSKPDDYTLQKIIYEQINSTVLLVMSFRHTLNNDIRLYAIKVCNNTLYTLTKQVCHRVETVKCKIFIFICNWYLFVDIVIMIRKIKSILEFVLALVCKL